MSLVGNCIHSSKQVYFILFHLNNNLFHFLKLEPASRQCYYISTISTIIVFVIIITKELQSLNNNCNLTYFHRVSDIQETSVFLQTQTMILDYTGNEFLEN